MKPRHAAVLALVGWYLVLPPTSLGKVVLSAPPSKWTVFQEYDSLETCLAARVELHERGEQNPSVKPQLQFPPKQLAQFFAADCISADDPKLKEK